MKTLIIYDSQYGNTERIARSIGRTLGLPPEVEIIRVSEVKPQHLAGLTMLVVGSPTQRFRPTPPISALLQGLQGGALKGVKVAAFDTRLSVRETRSWILNFFVKLAGAGAYADKHIAELLRAKGGELVVPPEGFLVQGTEGPLKAGELERAVAWAKQMVAQQPGAVGQARTQS